MIKVILAAILLAISSAVSAQSIAFPGPGTGPYNITPIGTPTSIGQASLSNFSASSQTLTTSAAIVAGNLVAVHVGLDTTNSVTVASISDGTNSYSKATSSGLISGAEDEIWYKANASAVSSGATLTVTFSGASGAGGNGIIQAVQVSGIVSLPLDQVAASTGTSTSLTETTGTLGHANEIAFGAASAWHGNGLTYSGASGFTNILGGNGGAASTSEFDYKVTSSTSAVSYVPTFTTSGAMAAAVATFKGN